MEYLSIIVATTVAGLIYCSFAAWVAFRADEQGYNRLTWFVVGLVATPLVTLVLVALLARPRPPRRPG